MSSRLSDVERSVILQSLFAISSALAYLQVFRECATPPHVQVCHCMWLSFTRPSPALVLQATNAGVRRPGYEATYTELPFLNAVCVHYLCCGNTSHSLKLHSSFGFSFVWEVVHPIPYLVISIHYVGCRRNLWLLNCLGVMTFAAALDWKWKLASLWQHMFRRKSRKSVNFVFWLSLTSLATCHPVTRSALSLLGVVFYICIFNMARLSWVPGLRNPAGFPQVAKFPQVAEFTQVPLGIWLLTLWSEDACMHIPSCIKSAVPVKLFSGQETGICWGVAVVLICQRVHLASGVEDQALQRIAVLHSLNLIWWSSESAVKCCRVGPKLLSR